MRRRLVLAVLVALAPGSVFATVPTQEQPTALVRALDKMTARVEEIALPVGKPVQFGALSIVARTCRVTLPEQNPPESAAYLDIAEIKPGAAQAVPVFDGWMFASSPALSAMQDPIYDVWVTGCKGGNPSANSQTPPAPSPLPPPPSRSF